MYHCLCRLACALLATAALSAPALAIEQYGYRVIDKKPQDRSLFIQGLEIRDGKLYVGSGNYGQSVLQRIDFASMEPEVTRHLNPRLFGEGVTVFGDFIYQLTWRERMLLVFKRDDLSPVEWHPLAGEGWGMTNDGTRLIYSDGSDRLYFLSPGTRGVTGSIRVTENGKPVTRLNELEWVDGEVWANIWQSDRIVIINPETGEVRASIDLRGLLPVMERKAGTDVLNGIAVDPATGDIWVTGKRWPWLYHIELVPVANPQ
ncbi:glutaminyl-peptide cyclotransferase [Mangrovimicrobium sediminis]|uniref:Glutaminyl-peptide cyclotransferase n=1 Tax=Mangrovimicrobium sediminis TaxID=2562682 RepID=A0A4Z0M9F8_9GAMM|nr:glutaminyl-peptide cyclotransferase [Haliea sp. SAOS-164]TGD76028.1 glutaminyl-peptide cyclotransferase [Haliea sp. SAOS-164]